MAVCFIETISRTGDSSQVPCDIVFTTYVSFFFFILYLVVCHPRTLHASQPILRGSYRTLSLPSLFPSATIPDMSMRRTKLTQGRLPGILYLFASRRGTHRTCAPGSGSLDRGSGWSLLRCIEVFSADFQLFFFIIIRKHFVVPFC